MKVKVTKENFNTLFDMICDTFPACEGCPFRYELHCADVEYTESIAKDIEEIFERSKLEYDRRLTKWNGSKYILPQGRTKNGESYWRIIADRLAAYENTGLEPDQISSKIKAIVKQPGLKPMLCEIDNTVKEMQMIVGGYIETVTMTPDLVVICNEDGRRLGLQKNEAFDDTDFVGTIILVGRGLDDFTDVPEYVIKMYGLG